MVQHGQWASFDTWHGLRHPDPKKPAILIAFLQKYIVKERFDADPQRYLAASPLHHAKQRVHDMPFLIVHGTKDIVVTIEDSRYPRARPYECSFLTHQ